MHRTVRLLAVSLVLSAAVPPVMAAAKAPPALRQFDTVPLNTAVADPHRDADRARDVYRHPVQTLMTFSVEPGMTVVDVMPGGGWYTRVLLPYLGARGRYIALAPPSRDASKPSFATTFPAKAAGWAGAGAAPVSAYTTDAIPAALDGTVDRVLIMREVHNLVGAGTFDRDLDTYRRLLKPGGLLGIEEHRAKPDAPDAYVDGSKGYMRQADVIRMVEARGFELIGKSEVNANPKDTADYPDGVWTLPPSYALKDKDRAKYEAIGESDRMTLVFGKR